jgi:hypothetical protein
MIAMYRDLGEAVKNWIGKKVMIYTGRLIFKGTLTQHLEKRYLLLTDVEVLKTKGREVEVTSPEAIVHLRNVTAITPSD